MGLLSTLGLVLSLSTKGGKDVDKDLKKVSKGFDDIKDRLDKLVGLQRVNTFAEGIKAIANNGQNLTTSTEALLVSLDQQSRKVASNYGISGKALSKFTQKAISDNYGLNISVDESIKASYNYMRQQELFKKLNLKTSTQLAKFTTAFGVNADEFTSSAITMQKSLGLSNDKTVEFIKLLGGAGDKLGDVNFAFSQSGELTKLMSARLNAVGGNVQKARLDELYKGTLAAAAGFKELTGDPKQGMGLAMELSNAFVHSQRNIRNMLSGTESTLDKFIEKNSMIRGNVVAAWKDVEKGPDEFMKAIAKTLQSARGPAELARLTEFIGAQLSDVFGPEKADQMLNFFRNADQKVLKAMANAKSSMFDFKKRTDETFRSGLTLAEQFERKTGMFLKKFRDISRNESVKFVKDTGKAMDDWEKKVRGIANEGGPLGELVKKLSEVHQVGIKAFLPKEWIPTFTVMAKVLAELAPALQIFHSLGINLGKMFGPLSAIAGIWGTIAYASHLASKKYKEHIALMATNSKEGKKAKRAEEDSLKAMEKAAQKAGFTKEGFKIREQIMRKRIDLTNAEALARAKVSGNLAAQADIEQRIADTAKQRNNEQIKEAIRGATEKIANFAAQLPQILTTAYESLKDTWPDLKLALLQIWDLAWRAAKFAIGGLGKLISDWWNADSGSLNKLKDVGKAMGLALLGGMFFSDTVKQEAVAGIKAVLGGAVGKAWDLLIGKKPIPVYVVNNPAGGLGGAAGATGAGGGLVGKGLTAITAATAIGAVSGLVNEIAGSEESIKGQMLKRAETGDFVGNSELWKPVRNFFDKKSKADTGNLDALKAAEAITAGALITGIASRPADTYGPNPEAAKPLSTTRSGILSKRPKLTGSNAEMDMIKSINLPEWYFEYRDKYLNVILAELEMIRTGQSGAVGTPTSGRTAKRSLPGAPIPGAGRSSGME